MFGIGTVSIFLRDQSSGNGQSDDAGLFEAPDRARAIMNATAMPCALQDSHQEIA